MKGLEFFHKYLQELPPEKRKKVQTAIVASFILIIGVIAYQLAMSGKNRVAPKTDTTKAKQITLEPKLLEKSFIAESNRKVQEQDKQMVEMQKQIEELKKEVAEEPLPGGKEPMISSHSSMPVPSSSGQSKGKLPLPSENPPIKSPLPPPPNQGEIRYPSPPVESGSPPPPPLFSFPPNQTGQKGQPGQADPYIGGIGVINQPEKPAEEKKDGKDKKADAKKIYLPPSFMEATLLSGIRAPTMEAAKSNPRPAFLRIKDIAVLPNNVKANLMGCFVIAEGNGDLSDERIHLRLLNLTCLAKNGKSVIDAKIKGVVIDGDGQLGLGGVVVTRMGALLGRTVIAGFMGGVGDAVRASTTTQAISPLGTTQTLNADKVLAAGVGSGLSSGFHKLEDFYLEMARQTFPVIEAGATKTVTVAITEGVELSIKEDYCTGGLEECQG